MNGLATQRAMGDLPRAFIRGNTEYEVGWVFDEESATCMRCDSAFSLWRRRCTAFIATLSLSFALRAHRPHYPCFWPLNGHDSPGLLLTTKRPALSQASLSGLRSSRLRFVQPFQNTSPRSAPRQSSPRMPGLPPSVPDHAHYTMGL